MKPVLIWDLPTRILHWMLSAGFIAAAAIALVLGEHSPMFPYHAIIGLAIALMVCLRIAWGVFGTRYARFTSFIFGPAALVEYLKGAVARNGRRHIGHNPASAIAIFAMLALMLALAATGMMMSQGNEAVEEVHEILAWAMVGVVIVHVIGVALHTMHYRENITGSMIHGMKVADESDAIASARPVIAAVLLAITLAWTFGLVRNYDASTRTTRLPIIGTALGLGEIEDGESDGGHRERQGHDGDDSD